MNKVTIIMGLPGSGKSTFLGALKNDEKDLVCSDWGWKLKMSDEGEILGSFKDDDRYNDMINAVKSGQNVIIDGSCLCDHKFLCEGEYLLNLNIPGVKIEKYYYENNPEGAAANVLYREHIGGNYWKKVENEYIFFGHHCVIEGPDFGMRQYEVIINNINKLTKNYTIPPTYTPLQIKVQDKRFYNGWKELLID